MRLQNSIKNIYIGILTQIIITILGFISRKVFLDSLGTEYLGLNGLLTNILSMLSLVEGGIGTSIIYSLYRPLAESNTEEVISLIQLYKKIYSYIAILVGGLSVLIYPFVTFVTKENQSISYLSIVYFIFVFKNIISYLNAHKWSLINADQRGYILGKYNLYFNIFTTIMKIIILKVTSNYVLYLLLELGVVIIQNIWNGNVVTKLYPYLKSKTRINVKSEVKKDILKNVKAIFLHNVGSYCVFGTDNILISALINLKTVGLYSNYTMVINQVTALVKPVINGVASSIGNLIVTENNSKIYEVFRVMNLVNFWIYGFIVIFLYNLLEPFIDWWIGESFRLDRLTFIIILLNFYITGLRGPINIFKEKAGIFTNDQYLPIVEAIINLGVSLILVNYFDLSGIFLGTTVSTLVIPFWVQSKIVYNNVFQQSVKEYFKKYIFYFFVLIVTGSITIYLCDLVSIPFLFLSLVVKGMICLAVINILFVLFFYRTKEFTYILLLLNNLVSKKFNINLFKSLKLN